MIDLMNWQVRMRSEWRTDVDQFPTNILTAAPELRHENLPAEIGLLLPTNHGSGKLIDTIVSAPQIYSAAMLGLFLADPLLNLAREQHRLKEAGVHWITNLPSTEQQDVEFTQQLSDVGLDIDRERNMLGRLRDGGFRISGVVTDVPGAKAMAEITPDAIIILPRIADFAAGFPSLHQRGSVTQEISHALKDAEWSGALLCLGDKSELEHERQWPDAVDGLLCRPELVTATSLPDHIS
jgi:hypothetical protein